MAVALANTLFFAAATGESKGRVALYLLITIAPFAVIAPLIGPALDRLQHGRRVALATSFVLRTALALVLIMNYGDGATGSYPSMVLYPCALAMMVFSKSFSVLRSAVTPRVMPPTIDPYGSIPGSPCSAYSAAPSPAAPSRAVSSSPAPTCSSCPGRCSWSSPVTIAGALLSMRIPRWVEVTEGEVPATLSYRLGSGQARRSWP